MDELVLVTAIVFLGATVRSFLGFGDAAVAMPLLALTAVPIDLAVPLVGLTGLLVALLAVRRGWEVVERAIVLRLAVATAVGLPFGLVLVRLGSEGLVRGVLGVTLLVYACVTAALPRVPRLARRGWAYPFGFAAGCLGSAYNVNGVPVAVYGAARGWSPERFRSTLQAYFAISSGMVVLAQGAGGLWTREVWQHLAVAVPAVLVAVPLGRALHGRVSADRFRRLVLLTIGALGAVLVVT